MFGSTYVRIKAKLELLKYMVEHKQGKIPDFEYGILKDFLSSYERWGQTQLYQTHPKLSLRGARPTISRYITYGLDEYLHKAMNVLDIGSNTGFFGLYVADKVDWVNLVEANPKLCNICKKVRDELEITNVSVRNNDITKYKTSIKYNAIFSFAIHKWLDISLDEYFIILKNLLKKEGFVLIETHGIKLDEQDELETFIKERQNMFYIEKEGLIDDQTGRLRKFFYLRLEE